MLEDERFNDDKTIIVLSFDENETWDVQNHIYTLVLGNGLPDDVVGTTDDTFYTHFYLLSTVEANWALKNLGRNDVNEWVNDFLDTI